MGMNNKFLYCSGLRGYIQTLEVALRPVYIQFTASLKAVPLRVFGASQVLFKQELDSVISENWAVLYLAAHVYLFIKKIVLMHNMVESRSLRTWQVTCISIAWIRARQGHNPTNLHLCISCIKSLKHSLSVWSCDVLVCIQHTEWWKLLGSLMGDPLTIN